MNFFTNINIDTILQAETVQFAVLIEAQFTTKTMQVWDGVGNLETEDGQEWNGLGEFLSMGDLTRSMDGSAEQTEIMLTGVSPEILQLALDASYEVSGNPIKVYGQVLEEERPVGNYFQIWSGTMDQPTFKGQGPKTRTIGITCEGLFVRRRRPVRARFSDRDQQARYPGDRGLELVATLVNKEVGWPNY